MISYCLLLLALFAPLTAELPKPEPPLPLSTEIPLEIDASNLEKLRSKQPEEQQFNLQKWRQHSLPWLGLLLLLLIVSIFLCVRYWSYFFPPKPLTPQEREELLRKRTLSKLVKIKNRDPNQWYISIGDLLKNYIEKQYHVPAMVKSTEELAQEMNQLSTENKEHVLAIVTTTDKIKFGKYQISLQECVEASKQAEAFISSAEKEGNNA